MTHRHRYQAEKYKLLLIVLFMTFFAAPLLQGSISSVISPLLLLVTILSVTKSFSLPKLLMSAYGMIAVIAYLLQLSASLGWAQTFNTSFGLVAQGIFAIYLGGAAYWIGRDIFTSPEVTPDTIRGGISVYLLIGFVWALFYGMVATLNPDAFSQPMFPADQQSAYQRTFHFSFTTLTTLGYGDIVPVSQIALVLTNLEAIIGQMYSTVFIAILVGGYLSKRN